MDRENTKSSWFDKAIEEQMDSKDLKTLTLAEGEAHIVIETEYDDEDHQKFAVCLSCMGNTCPADEISIVMHLFEGFQLGAEDLVILRGQLIERHPEWKPGINGLLN